MPHEAQKQADPSAPAAAAAGAGAAAASALPPAALVCHGHSRPIVEISYSPITPDGYFLISASKDGRPMLRNGETGDWIGTFEGHKGAVWSATLDAPALRAATASADFSAKLWDALTGDELHSFPHSHIVRTCDFSKDTKVLLTGGAEKILRLFNLDKLDAAPDTISGMPGAVRCARFHEDDKVILATCSDQTGVRIVDARSHETVRTIPTSAPCTSVEVSRDGNTITLADGSSVAFWDSKGAKMLSSVALPHKALSASLSPTGGVFAAGGDDMWVRIFNFNNGNEIACHKGHHGPVHSVRFAPDGSSCASGSEDGTIRIWRTGKDGTEGAVPPRPASRLSNGEHGGNGAVEEVAKKLENASV